MKFNPTPFQIQEYHVEGQRGRYIVISPEGFDMIGEHMPYKEAVSIVRHEKLLLKACDDMRILKIVAKLLTVGDVVNSLHDKSECQEWLQNALFLADDKQIREIIRKPRKLHDYLAKQAKEYVANSAASEKRQFIYKHIDVEFMKMWVTRLIDVQYLSAENINAIVAIILEYADMDNLRIMSEDQSFIIECVHLNVVEWEAEQRKQNSPIS